MCMVCVHVYVCDISPTPSNQSFNNSKCKDYATLINTAAISKKTNGRILDLNN